MSGNTISGAQAVLYALRQMGVERIFASPGSDWAPLWEAMASPHEPGSMPQYLSTRHEETAIGMASGYAKATGKLPAVVLHTTVGALHAAMGLRAALHERVPMVVLAGESVTFGERPGYGTGRQWLRLLADTGGPARLVGACVKWSFGLNTSAILAATVQRACQLAMSAPRGPVFLSVPLEFLMDPAGTDLPRANAVPGNAAAQPAAIDELAEALCGASNPVIVTEEIGKEPGAVGQLVKLAETLGAPVLEAWQPAYANFPRTHPLYGGVAIDMPRALEGADLVFLVEAVAPWHPPSALDASKTKVVVLGEDPLHSRLPYWGFRADLIAEGAAEPSLAILTERVSRKIPAGSRAGAIERWRERHERERSTRREQARAAGTAETIESRWVGHELNAVLPRDAIVVDETITHRLDIHQQLDRLGPGGYIQASFGGLGLGLGTALGARSAHPDRVVVLAIGDGAFHYNPVVASFGAAQEHGLPILVVLFNNAGYLSQKTDVLNEYPDGWAKRTGRFAGTSIVPRPDYPALARAYGGYGESAENPVEVRAALLRGLRAVTEGKLALIELMLAPVNPG
jgi:acetolactate synthase I/II/III large subunit